MTQRMLIFSAAELNAILSKVWLDGACWKGSGKELLDVPEPAFETIVNIVKDEIEKHGQKVRPN